MSLLIKGVTAHTALTDKEAAGVIDHADDSVTDAKIASGVGLSDTQIAKLPSATEGQALVRGAAAWGAGSAGIAGVKVRKNTQMPILGTRPQLNFIEGAAVDLKLADNPPDDEIDITISAKYPTRFMTLIPEDASLPTTNPAAKATVDGTNFAYDVLDFDPTTEESANWEWYLTPDYLSENIVVDIYWTSAGAGDAKFGFSTLGREKAEDWDVALGTERTVVQTNAGAGKMNKTRITTFAPGWSPGDVLLFKLARKSGDAADTIDANDVRVLKVVVSYTGRFAQSFYPLAEPVLLTGLINEQSSFQDMDISQYVPAGATGAILHIDYARGSGSSPFALRKKGSTDDRSAYTIGYNTHGWAMVGLDEARTFQIWLYESDDVDVYLVGYTATGVVFFDNAYDKSLTVTGSWQTIDLSAECPGAIGIIIEVVHDGAANFFGLRKNGSTDEHYSWSFYARRRAYAVIGCDAAQLIQGKIDGLTIDFYIIGYITEGAVFKTNSDDESPVTRAEWVETDLSTDAPKAIMAFFEMWDGGGESGLRKHGSSEDIHKPGLAPHYFGIVAVDSGQKCDIYERTGGEQYAYLMGYATWAGA